jgi:hypothetical protein
LDLAGDLDTGNGDAHRGQAGADQGVMAACDELDGVKDGVLENPQACRFDPTSAVCKPGDDPATCLTPAQAPRSRRCTRAPPTRERARRSIPASSAAAKLGWLTNPVATRWDISDSACSAIPIGIRGR